MPMVWIENRFRTSDEQALGAMSAAIPIGVAIFFVSVLGLGYELSIAVGVVIFVSLIVALWRYSFQPLDVKAQ